MDGLEEAESPQGMKPAGDPHRQQFVGNLAARGGLLVLQAVAAVWFTRYLVDRLGVAMYGLVPLALMLQRYVSVFTSALVSPLGRFLTVDMARADNAAANRTFNTGLRSMLFLAGVLLVPSAVLSYFAPEIFNIPPGAEWPTRAMFGASVLSCLVAAVATPFGASAFAKNRLDLHALQTAASTIVMMVVAVVVISTVGPSLPAVAAGVLVGAAAQALVSVRQWQVLTPELSVHLGDFDRSRFREIIQMSWHVFVNNAGSLLFLKIDLVVANLLLGVVAAGQYGAILQIPAMLRLCAGEFAVLVTPSVTMFHAAGQHEAIVKVLGRGIKWLGLAMAVPIGLLCAGARPLLVVWLGKDFAALDIVFIVMLAHLVVNLAVVPLFAAQVALNRVRVPAYVTLGLGAMNVGLAVALALPQVGLGALGIALAGGATLLCKNLLFTPVYAARILGAPWATFLRKLAWPLAVFLAAWGLGALVIPMFNPTSWPTLMAAFAVAGAIASVGVWFGALSRTERSWMLDTLLRRGSADGG